MDSEGSVGGRTALLVVGDVEASMKDMGGDEGGVIVVETVFCRE